MGDIIASVTRTPLDERTDRRGTGLVRLTDIWVEDDRGDRVAGPRTGQTCVLAFAYEARDGRSVRDVVMSFGIQTTAGSSLILHRTNFKHQDFAEAPPVGVIRCSIPNLPLAPGAYVLGTYLEAQGDLADDPGLCAELTVEAGDFFGTGSAGLGSHSPILVDGSWSLEPRC